MTDWLVQQAEAAGDVAEDTKEAVDDKVEEAQEAAEETWDDITESAGDVVDSAGGGGSGDDDAGTSAPPATDPFESIPDPFESEPPSDGDFGVPFGIEVDVDTDLLDGDAGLVVGSDSGSVGGAVVLDQSPDVGGGAGPVGVKIVTVDGDGHRDETEVTVQGEVVEVPAPPTDGVPIPFPKFDVETTRDGVTAQDFRDAYADRIPDVDVRDPVDVVARVPKVDVDRGDAHDAARRGEKLAEESGNIQAEMQHEMQVSVEEMKPTGGERDAIADKARPGEQEEARPITTAADDRAGTTRDSVDASTKRGGEEATLSRESDPFERSQTEVDPAGSEPSTDWVYTRDQISTEIPSPTATTDPGSGVDATFDDGFRSVDAAINRLGVDDQQADPIAEIPDESLIAEPFAEFAEPLEPDPWLQPDPLLDPSDDGLLDAQDYDLDFGG